MATEENSQKATENLIKAILNAEASGSVTPQMVANVLDYLFKTLKTNNETATSSITTERNDRISADGDLSTSIGNLQRSLSILATSLITAQQGIDANKSSINTLLGKNASDAIESFNEVIDFLEGVKDDETLVAKLNALNQADSGINTNLTALLNDFQGYVQSNNAAVEAAKVKLFDDIWKANGGTVNHANSAKPYRLNGLDLTYDEAVEVYRFNPQYMQEPMSALQNKQMHAVTNIAPSAMTKVAALNNFTVSTKTKVLSVNSTIPNDLRGWLGNSGTNVERILGNINLANFNRQGDLLLAGCVNLHTVEIKGIKVNLSIEKCGKLSYASMKYLVDNAANGSAAITVTVHADVYAKLTADTSNAAAAALTSDELTNWQAIATSAAAKNISFAKP